MKNITRCATSENEQEHNTQQTHHAFPRLPGRAQTQGLYFIEYGAGMEVLGKRKKKITASDRLRRLIPPSARASSARAGDFTTLSCYYVSKKREQKANLTCPSAIDEIVFVRCAILSVIGIRTLLGL